jgi:DnaJ homolog subfamily C member 8
MQEKNEEMERLLRDGHKWFNLNPFGVLDVRWDASKRMLQRRYRQLCLAVHPDKNDGSEQSQEALSIVNEAYERLNDPDRRREIDAVVDEAKSRVLDEKKEQNDDANDVDVDAMMNMLYKLFAELEQRKLDNQAREQEERQRERLAEIEAAEQQERDNQFKQQWDQDQQHRVDSWRQFSVAAPKKEKQAKKEKKKRKKSKKKKSKKRERADETSQQAKRRRTQGIRAPPSSSLSGISL